MNIKLPEKTFVYLALIFGVIFIVITPPFQSPDEDSHFKKSYLISEGVFFPTTKEGVLGNYIESSIVDYVDTNRDTLSGNLDYKFSYKDMYYQQFLPRGYTGEKFYNYSTASVSPVAYISPATGILFAKVTSKIIYSTSANTLYMLYFARFFSLIFYIFLIYLAVKTTPILKKTMTVVALLPTALFLAAAVTYDSILLAASMLMLSLIFKLSYNDTVKQINWKYILALIAVSFILLNIKTVYITLLALFLILPVKKFGLKIIIKKFLMILTGVLLITVIMKIPMLFLSESMNNDMIAAKEQLSFIFSNPIKYTAVLFNNIIGQYFYQLRTMIGTLGNLDTNLPGFSLIVLLFSLVITGIADISLCKIKFDIKQKLIVLVILVASTVGIYTALYWKWTSIMPGYGIGSDHITGVQGRYFLPLLFVTFLLFSNNYANKHKKYKICCEKILEYSHIAPFVGLVVSSLIILLRFWV